MSLRRTIKLLSVTLALAGFELASGTLPTTLNHFSQTLSSSVAADVPSLPPLRFAGGVGRIVLGSVGWGWWSEIREPGAVSAAGLKSIEQENRQAG